MAFLGQTFNQEDLPQSEDFAPIPAGQYVATVKAADVKDTKAGTGKYINIQWAIDGPSHAGRIVFDIINIMNPNSTAEEIGRQQLGNIMRAAGLKSVEDSDQLVGASCKIKVVIESDEKYGDSNKVKSYSAVSGSEAPTSGGGNESGGSKPPWQK